MIIKNRSKLERKHPNFDYEIGIVSSIANGVSSIVNTDFAEFFSSRYPHFAIDVKNFFLSPQPKELHVYDENNNCIFYQLFEKNGFCFAYDLSDPEILNIACEADVADNIHIFITAGMNLIYQVDFKKDNEYYGSCVIVAQNSQPVLEKYTFENI